MSALSKLSIVDLRSKLPRADWEIGRRPATTSVTWHWNGPAVASKRQSGAGLLEQLVIDARYQMQKGWGGTVNGADGIMYHAAADHDGVIYQLRDWDAMLWHCAHQDGNAHGLSVQCPVGQSSDGTEQPLTDKQYNALLQLTEAWRADFSVARDRTLGHYEWKHATSCPGQLILHQLYDYRAHALPLLAPTVVPEGIRTFVVRADLTGKANIRQGTGTSYPVAVTFKPGTLIYVDVVKTDGEAVNGDRRWVHMARIANTQADLGFLHWSVVQEIVPVASSAGLAFQSPASISVAKFTQVLQQANSPAAALGAELAGIPDRYGLNRAIALAFWNHENELGKTGLCAQYDLHNPGNVRTAVNPTRGLQLVLKDRGQFFKFASWQEGLTDWCERIVTRYINQGLTTVEQATPVYAPSVDGNAPAQYAQAVADQVTAWMKEDSQQ